MFVLGNPSIMRVDFVRLIHRGAWVTDGWVSMDLDGLKALLRRWYLKADRDKGLANAKN